MELLVFDTNTMISKRDTNHGIRNIYWTVYGDIRYQNSGYEPKTGKRKSLCSGTFRRHSTCSQHSFKEKTDIHIWDAAKIIIFAVSLQDLCNIFVILAKMYLCAYKKVWEPVHSFTLSHCFVTIEQNS